MADIRVTDKDAIATFSNPTTADYFLIGIVGGDKKMLASNVKSYVLGSGIDIGGTGAGDIVTIDATQTLTGKTLTSPKINEDVAVTATATELNVLDGIPATLTATELGYVDGVTSAIQTQLDAVDGAFAEIYITGGATGQTVTKTTWTALSFAAAGGTDGEDYNDVTADKANSKITVANNGIYLLTASITFTNSIDALTHQFSVYRDGSILNNTKISAYHITGANAMTVNLVGLYKEGAQPKDYQLRYYHNHSTDNVITISEASFIISKLI